MKNKENTERIELNILPFLAEAFSTNKKIYKKINELYNLDSDRFFKAAKENEFYNHKIGSDGNIEQEYYFKKALGILIVSSSDLNICNKVIKLIEYGWKYSASYVNSHKVISISDFLARFVRKNHGIENINDDELNATILVTVVLANYKGIEVDVEDSLYNIMLKAFTLRLKKASYENSLRLDNFTNEFIKKLERKLKERNKYIGFPFGSNIKINAKIKDNFKYEVSKLNLNEKFLLAFEYIYDLEDLSLVSIVDKDIFNSKELQELISCYTICFPQQDFDNIDIEELEKFIAAASQIRYLCRAYKKAKNFFFDNFQEELQKENDKLKSNISKLTEEKKKLKEENNNLNERLEELLKENNRLKAQLEEDKSNKKELVALREYIFANSEEDKYNNNDINAYSDKIDIEYINNIKGVIIGGTPNWIQRMKNNLPNWILIDPSSINFDKNILNNKHIFINTGYISHAMYYKVVENLGENSNIYYINNTNIEICLNEIYNKIK